jgi:AraC-like DNA-binding protein
MAHSACQQQTSPVSDHAEAPGLLTAARQLLVQRGPSVTLGEIAMEAVGTNGGELGCSEVIRVLLAQRLGDLLDVARARPQLQNSPVPGPPTGWADAARGIVLEHLERPDLSLRSAAQLLAVSPRTLQRRLADEGTSWRAIVDSMRRERVTALLGEDTTAEVTAARVGYAGSRALRRALRRWRESAVPCH